MAVQGASAYRAGARFHDIYGQCGALTAWRAGPPRSPLGPVTYHNFCQSANVLGLHDAPRRLITDVMGLELREMEESSVCCGFGGSTSVTRPEVAEQILARKMENILKTGAHTLVTDNPGCIMHMRGGLDAAGHAIRVLHIAELMAAHLKHS